MLNRRRPKKSKRTFVQRCHCSPSTDGERLAQLSLLDEPRETHPAELVIPFDLHANTQMYGQCAIWAARESLATCTNFRKLGSLTQALFCMMVPTHPVDNRPVSVHAKLRRRVLAPKG